MHLCAFVHINACSITLFMHALRTTTYTNMLKTIYAIWSTCTHVASINDARVQIKQNYVFADIQTLVQPKMKHHVKLKELKTHHLQHSIKLSAALISDHDCSSFTTQRNLKEAQSCDKPRQLLSIHFTLSLCLYDCIQMNRKVKEAAMLCCSHGTSEMLQINDIKHNLHTKLGDHSRIVLMELWSLEDCAQFLLLQCYKTEKDSAERSE